MAKKLTNTEFIAKARKVHGDKYDYSLTNYTGNRNKIIVICKQHGKFETLASTHLKANCPKCAIQINTLKHQKPIDTFIKQSQIKYNNQYDYSKFIYKGRNIKGEIICKEHGSFYVTPLYHLTRQSGCSQCKTKLKTLDFIQKAINKYGNLYTYEKVNYINNRIEVKVHCPKHGFFNVKPINFFMNSGCPTCSKINLSKIRGITKTEFLQKIQNKYDYDFSNINYIDYHTKIDLVCKVHGKFSLTPKQLVHGKGCKKCVIEATHVKQTFSTEEFILKANQVHNYKFDYSKVIYKRSNIPIEIICKKHGLSFFQTPNSHLRGTGCPICFSEQRFLTNEDFIIKSNYIHYNFYNYDKTQYKGVMNKVIITCPKHGDFSQLALHHLMGSGCPICSSSKGEIQIREWLKQHNIEFIQEYRFENCRNILPLPFDFYIPLYNLCIEYNGEQHYRPIDFSNKMTKKQLLKNFYNIQYRDKLKQKYCSDNNIKLLIIKFDENINTQLEQYLIK